MLPGYHLFLMQDTKNKDRSKLEASPLLASFHHTSIFLNTAIQAGKKGINNLTKCEL